MMAATSTPDVDVEIYVDGACIGNPGPGGWACQLIATRTGRVKELSGNVPYTTNNRMEIFAVIQGLAALRKPNCRIIVYSDSQYVVNTMTKGWSRGANCDLWNILDALVANHTVQFQWVRGHGDVVGNIRCDELANWQARNAQKG